MKKRSIIIGVSLAYVLTTTAMPASAHQPEFPPDRPAPAPAREIMPGFSWVVANQLAAMACPGRERPLAQDLAFLQQEGLAVLVSLTEEPIASEHLAQYGLKGLHLPVKDFTPPTMAQIEEFIAVVEQARSEGLRVGVHCTAGQGRTGTMLATFLVSEGFTAPEALARIRRLRPGSVENAAQEERVGEFAESIQSRHK